MYKVIKNVYGFFVMKEEFKLNQKPKSNTHVVYADKTEDKTTEKMSILLLTALNFLKLNENICN